MTASTEPAAGSRPAGGELDTRWRRLRELAQEDVLPAGRVAVACSAAYGKGGLGRHKQELLDALQRRGGEGVCVCRGEAAAALLPRLLGALEPVTLRSPAWSAWSGSVGFDVAAAGRLPAADHLLAFNGEALAQLRAARRAGMRSASLVSATSHMRRVVRMHALAHRQYPLEGSWAGRLLARNLAEYARADRIYVSSRHVWESFVEEGVPEDKLALFPLTPAARFAREAGHPSGHAEFRVVYVGGLSVVKGVPLLVDAVRRLRHPDIRLTLVGGWGTRGMRRFVGRARAADPRIEVHPGDPLPHLRGAALCVHPSWEDGFGYAPVEALACGVPVLVSENTGMKELVQAGRDGLVLPTGDLDALTEAIDAVHRREILV